MFVAGSRRSVFEVQCRDPRLRARASTSFISEVANYDMILLIFPHPLRQPAQVYSGPFLL